MLVQYETKQGADYKACVEPRGRTGVQGEHEFVTNQWITSGRAKVRTGQHGHFVFWTGIWLNPFRHTQPPLSKLECQRLSSWYLLLADHRARIRWLHWFPQRMKHIGKSRSCRSYVDHTPWLLLFHSLHCCGGSLLHMSECVSSRVFQNAEICERKNKPTPYVGFYHISSQDPKDFWAGTSVEGWTFNSNLFSCDFLYVFAIYFSDNRKNLPVKVVAM